MKPLLIFGDGELAELALFYFRQKGQEVAGFAVDGQYLKQDALRGLPVIAFEEAQQRHGPATHELFVAIGSSKLNRLRREKCEAARKMGYVLASCIAPTAVVHADAVGDNCLIMDMNNIHPYTVVGDGVIMSNSNHIGHHSKVGDYCFIAAGVACSGGVTIGGESFIGVNAAIGDHISIGARNVIGAGALIMKSTGDDEVHAGHLADKRPYGSGEVKGL